MTPQQRKELDINKSTLWYVQKNLREGKKVKLYDKVEAKISIGKQKGMFGRGPGLRLIL
jgi:hypothetical protein